MEYASIFLEKKEDQNNESLLDLYSNNQNNNNVSSIFNIRESNYGNLSVIDKMRGIQAHRLNMDKNITLAEMYVDKNLDKRFGNGQYNVTITDIYQNQDLFNEYHGLNTDGKVKIKENYMIDQEIGAKNRNENNNGGFEGSVVQSFSDNSFENSIYKNNYINNEENKKTEDEQQSEMYKPINFHELNVSFKKNNNQNEQNNSQNEDNGLFLAQATGVSQVASIFLNKNKDNDKSKKEDEEDINFKKEDFSFKNLKLFDFSSKEKEVNIESSTDSNGSQENLYRNTNNINSETVIKMLKEELLKLNISQIYQNKDDIILKYLKLEMDKDEIEHIIKLEIIKKSF